jgi:acetyl esterase/lipase
MRLARLTEAPSAETASFNAWLEATLAQAPLTHEVPPSVTRQARLEGNGVFPPGGPFDSARWRAAQTPLGRVRVTLPRGAPAGVLLHVHGGGWTLGAPDQYDAVTAPLAHDSGWAVASVPYRLAPEDPWPACIDDVEAAALWLVEAAAREFGTARLAIGGDSAGAHLAAAALLRLRARGLAGRFSAALLRYGVFDLRLTPSARLWGERRLILTTPTIDWFVDNLTAGDRTLREDPALSPLLADLSGFPPSLLQVGTADPLLDDTLFFAARLAAAGVPRQVGVYPGGAHAFDRFDLVIAREAQAETAEFLRSFIS